MLLADDHEIVREGLASLLQEEASILVVGQAANGREAVDLADRLRPDVAVIDVAMRLSATGEPPRFFGKRDGAELRGGVKATLTRTVYVLAAGHTWRKEPGWEA